MIGKCVGGPNHTRTLESDRERVEIATYRDHYRLCEVEVNGFNMTIKSSHVQIEMAVAGEYVFSKRGYWQWHQSGSKSSSSSSSRAEWHRLS